MIQRKRRWVDCKKKKKQADVKSHSCCFLSVNTEVTEVTRWSCCFCWEKRWWRGGMQVSRMTTAEIHTKTGTTTKEAACRRVAARRVMARRGAQLPLRQLLRDSQFFHLSEPVRVHIAFLHLMASAPALLVSELAAAAAAEGGGAETKANKPDSSLWTRMLPSTWEDDEVCEGRRRRLCACAQLLAPTSVYRRRGASTRSKQLKSLMQLEQSDKHIL